MSKTLYIYDPTKHDYHTDIVADDYVLQANETFTKPADGLYEPITWTGTDWIGTDKAIWQAAQDAKQAELLKTHPELAPQPTAEQQALTALAQQIADNDTNTATQITSIEQALTALATGTTKNGGNA